MNPLHPPCSCGNDGLCTTSGPVLLATVSFRQKVEKGRCCKDFERKKEQNEAEHEQSAFDGMRILVIPLGSVDSVLYPLITSDCKGRFTI